MNEIKCVSLEFPMCVNGESVCYTVGKNGVTKITRNAKNGEMARIEYFEIWQGDHLHAELHHYTSVIYFEKIEVKP